MDFSVPISKYPGDTVRHIARAFLPATLLALQSQGLSGGDILNICLNAIHAGSRAPDPAKWLVTEEMLVREIRRTKAAKEKHFGRKCNRKVGFSNL